jgi:hypothetical protein
MSSLRKASHLLSSCFHVESKHLSVDCTQVVQAVPVLQKGLRTPASNFFHHIWGHPWDEVEGCPPNSEAVSCDAGVSFVCCSENAVDMVYKLWSSERNYWGACSPLFCYWSKMQMICKRCLFCSYLALKTPWELYCKRRNVKPCGVPRLSLNPSETLMHVNNLSKLSSRWFLATFGLATASEIALPISAIDNPDFNYIAH